MEILGVIMLTMFGLFLFWLTTIVAGFKESLLIWLFAGAGAGFLVLAINLITGRIG